jgi:hypothetical protein
MLLHQRLARTFIQLQGFTSYETSSGNAHDTSEFLEYEQYQPVWFYELTAFPEQQNSYLIGLRSLME